MSTTDPRLLDTSTFLTRTIDLAPQRVPLKPGGYFRISDDAQGLERGVTRQTADGDTLRQRLGWGPFRDPAYVENDTSAFRKKRVRQADGSVVMRVVRPVWDQMLRDLQAGVIDGIIVYDLDRLVRQPRDLEDLIDIIEQTKRPVMGVTGQIDLMTSNGRTMARVMVSMALKSSEDTARRVARAALADAESGSTVRGGPRRYGWEEDAETLRESEAAIIREMTDRVVKGERVSSLVNNLNARQIPSASGKNWTRPALQTVLRSPRLAAIRGYQGTFQEGAKPTINEWWKRVVRDNGQYVIGRWTPILTVAEWEALQYALDGNQAPQQGSRVGGGQEHNGGGRFSRKHLLSGSVRCGKCGSPMIGKSHNGLASYSCRPKDMGGCNALSRNMPKVDNLIIEICIRRLERNGDSTFTSSKPIQDAGEEVHSDAFETRRQKLRQAYAEGKIGDDDFFATMSAIAQQASVVNRQKGAESRKQPGQSAKALVRELADEEVPNERKRSIIDQVIKYIIIKPSSRGPHFTPADIVPVFWGEADTQSEEQ